MVAPGAGGRSNGSGAARLLCGCSQLEMQQ
jgi:hypothetical protein